MILKEYINFERDIQNKLIDIINIEIKPGENNPVDEKIFDSFYILINIGHILQFKIDNQLFFCPPKNGILGSHKRPKLLLNEKHYYKFTIITLKDFFNCEVVNRISISMNPPFDKFFLKNNYCFSYAMNIEIIELLEQIYKSCSNPKQSNFFYLELESKFLHFLSSILKIILFEEHKYNNITASPDLKLYIIIKKLLKNNLSLDDLYSKFDINEEVYNTLYHNYFDNLQIEELREMIEE